ncbi:hypothetical protein PVAND_002509 [Polypedilum vanderplanki]|uniref:Protein-S-isoprenylcysteine O-methyltransferase n=1 Tax=Polypedilum vanderplanki TaxID=319348 RepID=A0A9J6BR78_POLVA|nr:hypothetical protein PVAND_002509 [Polypedilum vanderplanki]
MIFRNFCHKIKWKYLELSRNYSHKILFFGTDNFSLPSLKLITKQNDLYSRLEVVTSFKSKKNPIKDFANEQKLPVHDWESLKNDLKIFSEFDIGLVVSFGHLIPENIINNFHKGMLNVHASLLPKYRGASPIIYAIKNHETITGVSIMKIKAKKFDVGDVLAMKEVSITDDILMSELHDQLANLGAQLLIDCLKHLEECKPIKQDESQASYAPKIDKEFCKVRWNEMSAREIYDLYRALYSYKHVLTTFKNEPVKLLELKKSNEVIEYNIAGHLKFCKKTKKLLVHCVDGECIEINKLLIAKKVMSASDFNNGFLKNINDFENFQIAIRAGILGYFFGIALFISITMEDKYKSFGIYLAFLTFFHYSEYFVISLSHPESLTLDSFMLNHSIQYEFAAIISWIEYFVEVYYYPEMKKCKTIWIIGSTICLSGEILRKVAMLTAKKSFHHLVQFQQADDHKLITIGVYSWFRHPAYVGWFYWSIATQLIMANPICFVLYLIASWLFFKERIHTEEITLLNFFGQEYVQYQQRTKTGLPFINGYITTN